MRKRLGQGANLGIPKKSGKYFSGKYYVKFGHFVDECPDGSIWKSECVGIKFWATHFTRRPVQNHAHTILNSEVLN